MHTNEAFFAAARSLIPGGVNSPVRAFGSVGGEPYFVARGDGAHVYDVEGHRYIDMVQSYGAVVVGHAHPFVAEAIAEAARLGTSFGAPTPGEVNLAAEIVSRVPGMDRVRLVNSGTEATMSALRLARGHTGRDRVVKFAGNYHGHADLLLAAGGSGMATLGLSGSAGVPASAVADTLVAPYGVVPELDETIACVIVEPVAANMGLVAPPEGFLAALAEECRRVGALLIFDEVITGFRVGPSGEAGRSGVTPDLVCLGKIIGGGLPIGAFGGRAEIMASLAPEGPVYQAGTLSGNPLATAAGLTVLKMLDDDAYSALEEAGRALAEGLGAAFAEAGITARVPRSGGLVGLHFGAEPATDYDTARLTSEDTYARFFHGMLGRGVALAPGAYEVMFPGLAHTPAVIEEVVAAAAQTAAEMATEAG